MNSRLIVVLFEIFCVVFRIVLGYNDLELHADHLKYYFNVFPERHKSYCINHLKDPICNNRKSIKACWGYELNCDPSNAYSRPICLLKNHGETRTQQMNTFYDQADFGYVKSQRNEMMVMCEPSFEEDSFLECTNHLRFCRGRNIMINFTQLLLKREPLRYKMDVLSEGQIGGFCKFHSSRLKRECDHLSPLQSWSPELRFFTSLQKHPIPTYCDVVIDKPTFIMKIDATVNMYHHFCDFFNLYASLHVNSSDPDVFSTDVHILIWETYTYQSAFSPVFEAFTRYPIWDLKTFQGKSVCFRNAVFSLLPRMIFGLYYNTPLIAGCERSGLFDAFAKHILHRLNVPVPRRNDDKLRITFLSRDTMYRKVLNELALIHELKSVQRYIVNRVVYDRSVPFKTQLEITHNTDIFIGIHGAGLTHLLFLPDWAVIFELYNCEDPACYSDLARLRGIKYITWQDKSKMYQQDQGHHPDGGAHAKFTNYKFDTTEFMRLVKTAEDYIRSHPSFPDAKYKKRTQDEL